MGWEKFQETSRRCHEFRILSLERIFCVGMAKLLEVFKMFVGSVYGYQASGIIGFCHASDTVQYLPFSLTTIWVWFTWN